MRSSTYIPPVLQITDEDLPALPFVATRALTLLEDAEMSNSQLENLIERDHELELARKIMDVANSSFYAGRVPTHTIADAIARLGRRELYRIIIASAAGRFYCGERDPYSWKLWNHALATGMIGHILARRMTHAPVQQTFVAGLLHDIGKLIIYNKYPFIYRYQWSRTGNRNKRLIQIEAEHFPELAHAAISARLIRKWRLGGALVQAAAVHHQLENESPEELEDPILACLVSLASVVANSVWINRPVCSWNAVPELACARELGIKIADLEPIRRQIHDIFEGQSEMAGFAHDDSGGHDSEQAIA